AAVENRDVAFVVIEVDGTRFGELHAAPAAWRLRRGCRLLRPCARLLRTLATHGGEAVVQQQRGGTSKDDTGAGTMGCGIHVAPQYMADLSGARARRCCRRFSHGKTS